MTDQQKNQAIADKCPGRFDDSSFFNGWMYIHPEFGWTVCLNGSIIDGLNAMAVAEDTIGGHDKITYRIVLIFNSDGPKATHPSSESALCHATSRQRADAFAKVFGLW